MMKSQPLSDEQFTHLEQVVVDFRARGKLRDAMVLAEHLANSRPEQSSAWHTLGDCHQAMGNHQAEYAARYTAVKVLGNLADLTDEQVPGYLVCWLGWVGACLRTGRKEEAERAMERLHSSSRIAFQAPTRPV